MPWPALDASTGAPSVPIGAFSSTVSARSVDVDASKAFVQWLWVDQTEFQTDFALSYGFHIPARTSLAEAAEPLQTGPAADAVQLYQENGFTQTPILWTPASDTAYSDARTRMITEGADPREEIAAVQEIVESRAGAHRLRRADRRVRARPQAAPRWRRRRPAALRSRRADRRR